MSEIAEVMPLTCPFNADAQYTLQRYIPLTICVIFGSLNGARSTTPKTLFLRYPFLGIFAL